MPFLLRIILGRLVIFSTAILAFFGINPEINVPTIEEARVEIEERKEIITETITSPEKATEPIIEFVQNIIDQPIKTELEEVEPVPTQTNKPKDETPFDIDLLDQIFEKAESIQEELNNVEIVEETSPEPIAISNEIADVLLNIICVNREETKITVSTGSGVMISSNGVVLTNAHVAQLFLLEDYMTCSLYKEQLPTYGYKAELLYIPTEWVEDNYHLLNSSNPTGTGERDYALLAITESTNPALTLPSKFSSVNFSTKDGEADENDRVVLAGYPGVQASLFSINKSATLVIDRTTIDDVFTFFRTTIDVLTTNESPVAARGSSGGGVFKDDVLVGVITTTSSGDRYNKANAITTSYINRDIRNAIGTNLTNLVSGDVIEKSKIFKTNKVPELQKILRRGL